MNECMTEIRLHTIKPAKGSRTVAKRLGRGPGSGKGKTAGRGTKGQRARSGGKARNTIKGLKRIVLRVPKNRGFTSSIMHPTSVTVEQIDRWSIAGARVDVKSLKAANRIPADAVGAKIVNTGAMTKPVVIVDLLATPGARAVIEKAGGSFEPVAPVSNKGKKNKSKYKQKQEYKKKNA